MSKHISKLQQRSNTRTSLRATLTVKEAFIKEQTLRLVQTNSIKEKFESSRRDFKFRLLEHSYLEKLVNKIQAEVDFSFRNAALKYKPMTFQKHSTVCHHLAYNPGVPKLKAIITYTYLSECPHCLLQEGSNHNRRDK